jgi:hypothetical protein
MSIFSFFSKVNNSFLFLEDVHFYTGANVLGYG